MHDNCCVPITRYTTFVYISALNITVPLHFNLQVGSAKESCQWFSRINKFRYPMFFMCPADYYMAGVKSRHSNKREDRE